MVHVIGRVNPNYVSSRLQLPNNYFLITVRLFFKFDFRRGIYTITVFWGDPAPTLLLVT